MADKLATAFTPITNPASTRLLMLADEATGERYKISIADFFALVQSGAQFTGAVSLTGGVDGDTQFDDDITVGNGTGNQIITINGAEGNVRDIRLETNGLGRWFIGATGDPEIGGNVGSNLEFKSRDDTGASLSSVLEFERSTGVAIFSSLTGSGDRNVQVSSNGTLSAPTPVVSLAIIEALEARILALEALV